MKTCALILAALLLISGRGTARDPKGGEAWRAELTPLLPGAFPALPAGEALYSFGWSGLTAATSSLKFSRPRPGLARMDIQAQTVGVARMLWRLDAEAFSVTDAVAFTPLRTRQVERYRKKTSIIGTEFAPDQVIRSKGDVRGNLPEGFWADAPADRARLRAYTGKKAKRFKFPHLLDLHSALLFIRSQPLADGDVIRLVIYQDSAYLATVRVAGREKITVPAGTFPVIRLDLSLDWVDDQLALRPHSRFRRATGWISDDLNRFPIKVEAEIFVGSIWAELTRLPKGATGPAVPRPPGKASRPPGTPGTTSAWEKKWLSFPGFLGVWNTEAENKKLIFRVRNRVPKSGLKPGEPASAKP